MGRLEPPPVARSGPTGPLEPPTGPLEPPSGPLEPPSGPLGPQQSPSARPGRGGGAGLGLGAGGWAWAWAWGWGLQPPAHTSGGPEGFKRKLVQAFEAHSGDDDD